MFWIGVAPPIFTAIRSSSRIASGRFKSSRSQPWYSHNKCRPSAFMVPPPSLTSRWKIRTRTRKCQPSFTLAPMLDALLSASPPQADSLRTWWDATSSARTGSTIERALLGGALADRLGFAFASGYAEALRFLVPDLGGITALCATEEAGNHPRAIRTTLADGILRGHKKWATVASEA